MTFIGASMRTTSEMLAGWTLITHCEGTDLARVRLAIDQQVAGVVRVDRLHDMRVPSFKVTA